MAASPMRIDNDGDQSSSSSLGTFFSIHSTCIRNATGSIPVQRQSHSAILHDSKMLIFGGYKGRRYFSDLYEYNCTSRNWVNIPIVMKSPLMDEMPRGRMWHSGIGVHDKMIIFGGETDDEKDLNDMYELDLKDYTWTQVRPTVAQSLSSAVQNVLSFTTSILQTNTKNVSTGSITAENHTTMYQPVPISWPCTRSCHSTVLRLRKTADREIASMVVFGGNNDGHKMNDLYEFVFEERRWYKWACEADTIASNSHASSANRKAPVAPKARYNHAAVMRNKTDKMYVLCGKSGPARLSDLWCFDFKTGEWLEVETFGHKPTPRSVHAVAILPGEDQMLVFGGYDGNKKMNDMFVLDLNTMKWRQLTIYGDIPNPTSNLSMVCSPTKDEDGVVRVRLFGGYNGDFVVSDLYELEIREIREREEIVLQQQPTIPCEQMVNDVRKLLGYSESIRSFDAPPTGAISVSDCVNILASARNACDLLVRCDNRIYALHQCIVAQSRPLYDILWQMGQRQCNSFSRTLSHGKSSAVQLGLYATMIHVPASSLVNDLVYLQLDGMCHAVFEQIVNYLYGVTPKLSAAILVDLISAAHCLELQQMVGWCLSATQKSISTPPIAVAKAPSPSTSTTPGTQNMQETNPPTEAEGLINVGNIVTTLHEADSKNQQDVMQLCIQFFRCLPQQHRDSVVEKPEFHLLSKAVLVQLLKNLSDQSQNNCETSSISMDTSIEEDRDASPRIQLEKHIRQLYDRVNTSPIEQCETGSNSPCTLLGNPTARSSFSDVLLVPRGGSSQGVFFAHKSILMARCPYFSSLLSGSFSDSSDNMFVMEELSRQQLELILKYIYGHHIVITPRLRIASYLEAQSSGKLQHHEVDCVEGTPCSPYDDEDDIDMQGTDSKKSPSGKHSRSASIQDETMEDEPQETSTNDVLMDLTTASGMLLLPQLETLCLNTLAQRITPQNVLQLLKFANEMQLAPLRQACHKELRQTHNKQELIEIIDALMSQ